MLVLLNLEILLHVFLQQKNWQEYCFALIFLVLFGVTNLLGPSSKVKYATFSSFSYRFCIKFRFSSDKYNSGLSARLLLLSNDINKIIVKNTMIKEMYINCLIFFLVIIKISYKNLL